VLAACPRAGWWVLADEFRASDLRGPAGREFSQGRSRAVVFSVRALLEKFDAEHGHGILMMRSYMDQMHYDCGGTEVRMRKKTPSAGT
jgi:hypothetical protein